MTHRHRSLAIGALLAIAGSAAAAQGGNQVHIIGVYDPASQPGIAVLPTTGPFGDSIRTIINRDLDHSDRFTVVALAGNDPAAFRGAGGIVNLQMLRQLGARYVVHPTATASGVHVAVYDVLQTNPIKVLNVLIGETPLGRGWRLRIHMVADDIEEVITGSKGISATRIAFVRHKRISLIDSDGYGDTHVGTVEDAYSPAWHPNGDGLVYATMGESRILFHDFATGGSRVLIPYVTNISYQSPSFSPDGQTLYFTHSGESRSAIYTAHAPGWAPRRLTPVDRADYFQAAVSPLDGNRLALSSNRTGHNEVYVMNKDGSGLELIHHWSDYNQDNASRVEPDWSPDQSHLAFITRVGGIGKYQLMIINLRNASTTLLTSEGINHQPSWAPDSRHIVFTSDRSGVTQLWILDILTKRVRQLTHNQGSKLASWSPRLTSR